MSVQNFRKMSFRGNQNQNRNRNYGGNMQGGVGGNRMGNLSPWGVPNNAGNYGNSGGNMRQGGGGGGGQGMNAQALNLANNLLSNLFRTQNPPSLLDLPRGGGGAGGGGGGGMGNRNRGAGPMMNRGGGNRPNNRRGQGNFANRGPPGNKQHQKQPMGGGIRKQNSFDRAKKVLAKTNNKNNNKRDAQSLDDSQKEGGAAKESPYANVPNDLFYCHLCKKHMWDALSFENHIKGRTHLMVREGIEESYRLKANMIRQEAKIAEQLKSIELDRLKRMGKSNQRQAEYCTMCDLHFHGHITGHRKSEDHLQLKKFLHPKCSECNEEFATRIDYDSHLLSAEHLLKAAEKNTKVGERKRNALTILTAEDELKDIRQQQRRRKKADATATATSTASVAAVKKEGEGGEAEGETGGDGVEVKQEPVDQSTEAEADGEAKEGAADETKEDEELNETHEEVEPAPNDPEDCILDYAEGDEIPIEVESRLPKYNSQRPVGLTLIKKLECYECVLCAKFLDTEQTAELHSRTGGHHRNFLKFINEKASDAKIAQKRAAAALECNERKKRRLEENEAAKNGQEIKTETEEVEEHANEENLYDPAQATGEDDVEMRDAERENNAEQNESQTDADAEAEVEQENGEEEQEAEIETEPKVESQPEPEPAPAPESKPAVVTPKATPVKTQVSSTTGGNTAAANTTTPTATTPAAGAPNNSTPEQTTPARKNTAIRGGGAAGNKGTPRGRGRGRYNRY